MINISLHKFRTLAGQRQLLSVLLLCWLIAGTVSFIHAQSHYLSMVAEQEQPIVQSLDCQLCANSFQLTPFILFFIASVLAVKASTVITSFTLYRYQSATLLLVGNRDPPLITPR